MHKLTPDFSFSIQPFIHASVRIRASYKNIFRVPSFDDLYFTNIGNPRLRPENSKQYNLGLTTKTQVSHLIRELAFTTDAYYNKITDKILAVPRQNLFQWTTLNIGKTSIKGLDLVLHAAFFQWHEFDVTSSVSYTFQRALDISNPTSLQYKTQLPYTPEHTAGISMNFSYRKLSLGYNILSSSYRYRLGDEIPENVVQGWATHDISLACSFTAGKYCDYRIIAEANNIYNLQYEIIKFYPMPRFNYRVGVTACFKQIHNHKNKST